MRASTLCPRGPNLRRARMIRRRYRPLSHSRHGRRPRRSMIRRKARLRIAPCRFDALRLRRGALEMPLVQDLLIARRRSRRHPARSVKAGPRSPFVSRHPPVHINVVDHRGVHAHHRRVVAENIARPHAPHKTGAVIAPSVIHTPVIAHLRSPVAVIPPIHAVVEGPVPRRPQKPWLRRRHPYAGHPVIPIIGIPRPVPRRPEIAFLRTRRLLVDRQRRRRNIHTDSNADLRHASLRRQPKKQGGQ